MKTISLAAALLVSGSAFAQQSAEFEASCEPQFAGTYHYASRTFIPGDAPPGVSDVIFNQSALSGFFAGGMNGGNTYIDEGRVPSPSSAAPVGTNRSYTVDGFFIGYCTRVLDVSLAGPGAHVQVGFLDRFGANCDNLAASAPQTVIFDISGLPASAAAGTLACWTVFIDLTGGGEFCLSGDGEGDSDGNDLFGYTMKMFGEAFGTAGFLIAGHPAVIADDTVFTTGGAGAGSGLDAQDLFFREGDGTSTTGCFFYGGYDPVDNNPPFSSHYMIVTGSADGVDCAECPNDDRYDTSPAPAGDDCTATVDLAGDASLAALSAVDADLDHYRITVPVANRITATSLFSHAQADLDMQLWNADCSILLDGSFSVSDNEDVTYLNTTGADVQVVIEMYVFPEGTATGCGDYELDILLEEDACLAAPDDGFAPNHDCASAVAVGAGAYPDLFMVTSKDDWFEVSVPPFTTAFMQILFTHADADIDLRLWDGCAGTQIDSSLSVSDNEQVTYDNATGAAVSVFLEVDELFVDACADYTLVVSLETGQPGREYCTADPTSTGVPASIYGLGSSSLSANDLTIVVAPMPPSQFGILFYGPNQVALPFLGGPRTQCVGGGLNRILPPGISDGFGVLSTYVDTSSLPGFAQGVTSYFQGWFRDALTTPNFNLSTGYCVTFTE